MVLATVPDRAMKWVMWSALASVRSFAWAAASGLLKALMTGRATASMTASGARASAPEMGLMKVVMLVCSSALLLEAATVTKTAPTRARATARGTVRH